MRVYVVETLDPKHYSRRVMDVFQSTEAARAMHRADDWAGNAFDEWQSTKLHLKMTPHETKG